MAKVIVKPEEKLDAQLARAIPSQIPVIATKASYHRMLLHCQMQTAGTQLNLWACSKTGAAVKGRMVKRSVYERSTNQFLEIAPVIELYCQGCDKPPTTRGFDFVFSDELQTLSM